MQELPLLLADDPSTHGLLGRRWNLSLVTELIRRRYGVRYHPAHVGRLLRSLHVRLIN
jgi:transposase